MLRDMDDFDRKNAGRLRSLWFLGDVHGEFKHIAEAVLAEEVKPKWLVLLGDIDIDHISFGEVIEPLRRNFPETRVAFIHGNHDADSVESWECLHNCGDAVGLHGKVTELNGIKVAGLGGNFMARIWAPPSKPSFESKDKAMDRGPYQWRDGQRPNPSLHGAIYPDDFKRLAKLRADILITHEAPSCHPYGWEALNELARSMRVVRSFHGHMHDDRSDEYALVRDKLQFDARAVNYTGIKNGLGEVIRMGPVEW